MYLKHVLSLPYYYLKILCLLTDSPMRETPAGTQQCVCYHRLHSLVIMVLQGATLTVQGQGRELISPITAHGGLRRTANTLDRDGDLHQSIPANQTENSYSRAL